MMVTIHTLQGKEINKELDSVEAIALINGTPKLHRPKPVKVAPKKHEVVKPKAKTTKKKKAGKK